MRKPAFFKVFARNLAVFGFASILLACSHAPPEQALRETIGKLQQAIEQRDNASLRDALADDFIGPDGLDRNGARRMAQGMFLRHQDVGVTLGPLDIDVQGEHATVRCTAALIGGSGGLLPDSGRLYQLTSGWRLDGDEWRLTSLDWTSR